MIPTGRRGKALLASSRSAGSSARDPRERVGDRFERRPSAFTPKIRVTTTATASSPRRAKIAVEDVKPASPCRSGIRKSPAQAPPAIVPRAIEQGDRHARASRSGRPRRPSGRPSWRPPRRRRRSPPRAIVWVVAVSMIVGEQPARHRQERRPRSCKSPRSSACGRPCRTGGRGAAGRGSCRPRTGAGTGPVRSSGHAVELREDQGIGEEDRVVEEGLRDHQRQAEDRPPGIGLHHRPRDQAEADVVAGLDRDRPLGRREGLAGPLELGLDLLDDLAGLLLVAVRDEPAGALRDVVPVEDDDQAEQGADGEADPPADVDVEEAGVEERDQSPAPRPPRRSSSCR